MNAGTDYPDCEAQSYTSDSVFQDRDDDEDEDDDTENEIDEFSTDSDVNSDEGACYSSRKRSASLDPSSTPSTERQQHARVMPVISNKSSKSSLTLVEGKELSQMSLTCDDIKMSASTERLKDKTSWTQETLF